MSLDETIVPWAAEQEVEEWEPAAGYEESTFPSLGLLECGECDCDAFAKDSSPSNVPNGSSIGTSTERTRLPTAATVVTEDAPPSWAWGPLGRRKGVVGPGEKHGRWGRTER